ncbi:hypothetical protein GCM10009681_31050 [Luedemannella helvata]|uniref:Helix-hairpin-helix DNA-binding motif class 1 domain-containing protein n=1 Tax=Luedemannella helvata TaxID=349315 RepID=A0ABN2KJP0_9ACTN
MPRGHVPGPAGPTEPDEPWWRRVSALNPGRAGLRALGVVAALVALVAGFLAWQARPAVTPVPPSSVETGPAPWSAGPASSVAAVAPPSGAVEIVLSVTGRVRRPGLVRLPAGARVADAIAAAGGALPGTDLTFVNLARKVIDGELLAVGVTPPPGVVVDNGPAAPGASAGGGGPVNLNTATLDELQTLPGVGPVLAQRILDYRTAQGGFRSVGDLRKVSGIGDTRFAQLKDLVTV